jgi:regulator of sigma E protease
LPVNITIETGPGVTLFEGVIEKNTVRKTILVTPRINPPEGQGALGVGLSMWPYVQTVQCQVLGAKCPFMAVGAGVKVTGVWMGRIVDGLKQIGKIEIAGPIGIYQLTGMVADQGAWPLVELVAILSVNLAVFNILPIPALDGGRLLFIGIEAIIRRRISPKWEQKINSWGMAVLLGLMALITLQDIVKIWWK